MPHFSPGAITHFGNCPLMFHVVDVTIIPLMPHAPGVITYFGNCPLMSHVATGSIHTLETFPQ